MTDTAIRIGPTTSLSGTYADYGNFDQMTALAAANPDVWISMLGDTQCTQGCAGVSVIGKEKLGGDGMAGG